VLGFSGERQPKHFTEKIQFEALYSPIAMIPDLTDEETALIAEAKKLGEEINALLLPLVAARKNWLRARNEANRQTLDALQAQADALAARHAVLLEEMQRVSGIPEEVFGAMEKARIRGNAYDRISRGDLTAEKVTKTGDIDKFLPTALEEILRLIDPSWVKSGRCWINGLGLR
jgi:hypothetical protein